MRFSTFVVLDLTGFTAQTFALLRIDAVVHPRQFLFVWRTYGLVCVALGTSEVDETTEDTEASPGRLSQS